MDTAVLSWADRVKLAERFAPHLVLFPEEQGLARPGKKSDGIGDYHPRGVGLLLAHSTLFAGVLTPQQGASLHTLSDCKNPNAQLRILGSPLPNPDLAWKSYFGILDEKDGNQQTGRERFPPTIYARVQTRGEANAASQDPKNLGKEDPLDLRKEVGRPFFKPDTVADDDVSVQYWFCYYYDDWENQHEGDWEGICIFLRRDGTDFKAVGTSYYAHETGTRRHWEDVERTGSGIAHPLVYVAAGSHASYFQYVDTGYTTTVKNVILPLLKLKLKVGFDTARVDRVLERQRCKPIKPGVELLPDPIGPDDKAAPAWENIKWLAFPGRWGINVLGELGYGGPTGPRWKGLKWCNPFAWMERHCGPDFLAY